MSVLLPTRTDVPRYDFELELESVTYKFDFEWSDREEAWYMSIKDLDGVELLSGRKIVLSYPLTVIHRDAGLPPGTFIAFDTSDKEVEAGFADLGDRVKLLYIPSDETI